MKSSSSASSSSLLLLTISVSLLLGEKCSLVSDTSPCGDNGTCHLQSRRPVPSSGAGIPRQITCSCGGYLPMDNCTSLSSKTNNDQTESHVKIISIMPDPAKVAVIDHIAVTPDKCRVDTLVAALSYWCQGKPSGCSIDEQLWRSAMPECDEDSLDVSVRWHYEEDYNSREIPCPSYGHGALEKKFIPLENTCFIKTIVKGSWKEARRQCWDWGGELSFPLLSNNTTPKSWMQDDEEIWLAGKEEFHARPTISFTGPQFQEGTYMVCFSDLWRCTDNGPHLDLDCSTGSCKKARRGLCAIPPRRTERSSPNCPEAVDHVWGLKWPSQAPESIFKHPCPQNQKGQVTWQCGQWGLRTTEVPDYSKCVLTNIDNHVMNLPGSDPATILDSVNKDIDKEKSFATGDIEAIVNLLDAASNIQEMHVSQAPKSEREELSEGFWKKSVETIDHLVSQPQVWLGLTQDKIKLQIDNIQNILDNAAKQLVDNLKDTTSSLTIEHTENVNIQVKVVNHSDTETKFGIQGSKLSLKIGDNENNETSLVVLKSYNNLGCIINRQKTCESPNEMGMKQVNSKVIGADVYKNSKEVKTNVDVVIIFEHVFKGNDFDLSSIECVFWDKGLQNWNSSGCTSLETSSDHTTCQCTHLTNFAVLMDINGLFDKESAESDILSYVTISFSSLSIFCLFLCLYVFICVPGLKSDRIIIHRHLCATLLLGHLLLLTGLDVTSIPRLCFIIAISLHFLFLSTFSWMLVEGYHIYKLLTDVFNKRKCGLFPYYLVGYGVPTIIVASSITCSEVLGIHGYGTEQYCWLTIKHGFIWSFGGPVAAVVVINVLIFIMAMSVARKAITRKNNADKKTELITWLKGSLSLLSILGISWIFGFLYMNKSMQWMGAVFTVMNSLQGVAIFFFHVVFNDLAKKKLLSHLQRRFHIFQFVSMSRSETTKRTVRKKFLGRNHSEMSFVEDSYSQSVSDPVQTKAQENLELSDSGLGSGYHKSEISCTGATYGSEEISGVDIGQGGGKKIIGTEGRPDFDSELRSEHKSSFAMQTRNAVSNYGALGDAKDKFENNNNDKRFEPEPDY